MDNDPLDTEAEADRARVQEELDVLHDFHRLEDFKVVMSTVEGRRFIWGLLEEAGVYNCSFDGTTEGTIFSEGQRNMGLRLVSLIHETDPGMYAKMIKEKKDYERHIVNIQSGNTDTE